MRMPKAMRNSTIEVTTNLPRVVLPKGKVAHILSSGSNIYTLSLNRWEIVDETVCHRADGYSLIMREDWPVESARWATPDDPTCKDCLRVVKNL